MVKYRTKARVRPQVGPISSGIFKPSKHGAHAKRPINMEAYNYASTKFYWTKQKQSLAAIQVEFDKVTKHIKNMAPNAVYAAMYPTFELSLLHVPEDSGALKASGGIELDKGTVVIYYGRNGYPHYSAMVHERTDIGHLPSKGSPLASAKFLQVPFEKDMDNIVTRIKVNMGKMF